MGAGQFPIYENAFLDATREIGYSECELLAWNDYFKQGGIVRGLVHRIEMNVSIGFDVSKFASVLYHKCKTERPNIVFLYSCRIVPWRTIKKIRELGLYIASYCNDDPFTNFHRPYYWRNWRKATEFCNINYVYRTKNISEVQNISNVRVDLLLPYYRKKENYICKTDEIIKETPDVIFLGHLEQDERVDYLKAILQEGITIGLNESEFFSLGEHSGVKFLEKPRLNYNRYICSCKIPIVFLSKINNDTYTRRCFEIPAAGAFLFCPYTKDLANIFEEGKEIVFYYNKADFVEKIKYYLEHDNERMRIAEAGRKKVIKDGHEASDRVKTIIQHYFEEVGRP